MFALMCAVMLLAVACKPKEPEAPAADSYVYSNVYYGDTYTNGAASEEIDYILLTDSVEVDADGYPMGTGYAIWVVSYPASAVNENFFPGAGTYTMSEDVKPGGLLPGVDIYADYGMPGYAFDGCYVREITDGEMGEAILMTEGTMTIEGTEDATVIKVNFKDEDGKDYVFTTHPAAFESVDGRPEPVNQWEGEPETATTVDAPATSAEITTTDGAFKMVVYCSDGYQLKAYGFLTEDSIPYFGTFSVSDTEAAGTLLASEGYDGESLYYTFYGLVTENGIDISSPIYYMEGGSVTISAEGVTGSLTSHFGSTININYTGEVTVTNPAAAPRRMPYNFNMISPKAKVRVPFEPVAR